MSRVFFSVGMSLDGFIAPETRSDDPDGKQWFTQWMRIHHWVFPQRFFRENLKLGDGGETGPDNDLLQQTFERTGATILGKRMFEAGEKGWPEEAPFHTAVFVLTHEVRSPWVRPGGTTFYFVNDGIESALSQAREVAGDRDVRIGGGADVIRQYLRAGLVDEFALAVAPVFLGVGIRLFEETRVPIDVSEVIASPGVTHLRYRVSSR